MCCRKPQIFQVPGEIVPLKCQQKNCKINVCCPLVVVVVVLRDTEDNEIKKHEKKTTFI